jgi:hypothetical protein
MAEHLNHYQPVVLSYASNRLPAQNIEVGTPESALTFPTQVQLTDGKASFELSASDPGNPRQFIDGQVYGVGYAWGSPENPDMSDFISVLVHTEYTYEGNPTWWGNVEPIFSQYARLYPYMKNWVNLADYNSVKTNASAIQNVMFEISMQDPNCMPVTRDLSRSKSEMSQKWFKDGMPEGTRLRV